MLLEGGPGGLARQPDVSQQARDILTHCFHGSACGILADEGNIRASVREAIERGVILDVGHGSGSFSWDVVETALAQDVAPKTISSDLHIYNVNGPVYDLAHIRPNFCIWAGPSTTSSPRSPPCRPRSSTCSIR